MWLRKQSWSGLGTRLCELCLYVAGQNVPNINFIWQLTCITKEISSDSGSSSRTSALESYNREKLMLMNAWSVPCNNIYTPNSLSVSGSFQWRWPHKHVKGCADNQLQVPESLPVNILQMKPNMGLTVPGWRSWVGEPGWIADLSTLIHCNYVAAV